MEKNGKWGFINRQNQTIIPFKYDYAEGFNEGLAAVAKKNEANALKLGYINTNGQEVIGLRFDGAMEDGERASFENGKATVSLDGVRGTLDRTGKFTPDPHQTEEPVE